MFFIFSKVSLRFGHGKAGISVVFWVDPLFLVPLAEVVSNIVGSSHEVIEESIVRWVFIQVLFGNA